MNDCIFCKIISEEIPCIKIYEDEKILAFLDIKPVNIGHTLIIPKEHYKNIYETPEEILKEMISVSKRISVALKSALNADGINITMNNEPSAGQVVFHSHIHIIPRIKDDGFLPWYGKRDYRNGEKEETAEKIKRLLP
ncbi:MAG: HIT family protein [Candidatus Paceibacterota bacterium]